MFRSRGIAVLGRLGLPVIGVLEYKYKHKITQVIRIPLVVERLSQHGEGVFPLLVGFDVFDSFTNSATHPF
jgi:hypothetical protein